MTYSRLWGIAFLIVGVFQDISLASNSYDVEHETVAVSSPRVPDEVLETEAFFEGLQHTKSTLLKDRFERALTDFLREKLVKKPVRPAQLRQLLEQQKALVDHNMARLARSLEVPYSTLYDFLNQRTASSPTLSKKLPVIVLGLFPVRGISVLRDIGFGNDDFAFLRRTIEQFDFSDQSIVHPDLFERMSTDTNTSVRSVESVCEDIENVLKEAPTSFRPSVNLSGNCIERGVDDVVVVLQRCALKELNLRHTDLSETQVKALDCLVVKPSLRRLDIRGNIGANVLTFRYLQDAAEKENPGIEILWED